MFLYDNQNLDGSVDEVLLKCCISSSVVNNPDLDWKIKLLVLTLY